MDSALQNELKDALQPVADRIATTEAWIADVERRFDTLRRGDVVADNLKACIPTDQRQTIEILARSGAKDPVRDAAVNAWFKSAARMLLGQQDTVLRENFEKLSNALDAGYQQKASWSLTDANGGYTTPTTIETQVLHLITDNAIVRPLARKIPVSSDKHGVPAIDSAAVAYVSTENTATTPGEPTFKNTDVTIRRFTGYGLASMEVLEDSAVGLQQLYLELMSEQIARLEDGLALEGTAGDAFTGLIAASGVNEVTNGTDGAAPTYAKFVSAKWKAGESDTRRGASWVMSPLIAALLEGLVDSQGRPIFVAPIAGNTTTLDPSEGRLLGMPLYTSSKILTNRAVGASGNVCSNVYVGPFQKGMLFLDRTGLSFAVSPHVKFAEGSIAMRLIKRTGIHVGLPAAFTKITGFKTA